MMVIIILFYICTYLNWYLSRHIMNIQFLYLLIYLWKIIVRPFIVFILRIWINVNIHIMAAITDKRVHLSSNHTENGGALLYDFIGYALLIQGGMIKTINRILQFLARLAFPHFVHFQTCLMCDAWVMADGNRKLN